jgi:hydroxymethylpyrimidine/phosphomethylpyrimidine kinase
MIGRVLVIAGSDSGGGAGIQADVKTITCLGGYAMTAVTALTAQNTVGVHGIFPVPPDFIAQQIDVVLDDIGADVIKIGMLGSVDVIERVADTLKTWQSRQNFKIVLDPVMVAKGGDRLLAADAIKALCNFLLPMADIVTPNLPEASALTGMSVAGLDSRRGVAAAMLQAGAGAVLMKGGHDIGDDMIDLLIAPDGEFLFAAKRINTPHTHGTGCTMASAIAVGLAQNMSLEAAVGRAHQFVAASIARAPGLGRGHGPLLHGYAG